MLVPSSRIVALTHPGIPTSIAVLTSSRNQNISNNMRTSLFLQVIGAFRSGQHEKQLSKGRKETLASKTKP